MNLTDIISNADLALFPEVAMVIFLGVFALVLIRTLLLTKREDMVSAANMVFDDDAGATTDQSADNSPERSQ